MDATGSMSSSIQAMSNAVIEMLDNIVADVKADTGFDAILRVGVVGYRDPFVGDESEFIPFTFDNAAVDQFLGNLAAVGGGDTEEDVNGGLKIMLDQEWTSEHKFIVHIADANGLGIPAPDAAGIDYADLFAEINEKQITYIFGKLNSNTDPMIAAYNEVYAVNEAGVLVEDASDAEIDILNLQGLSASDMTVTFTTELVNKIVTRVEEKIVTQELGQWAICTTSVPSVSPTTAHPTSLPSIAPTTEEPTNAPTTEEPTNAPTTEEPTNVPSVSTSAPTVPSTSSTSTDLCVSGVDCQTKCDAEYGASFAVDVDVSLETNTCTCTTETTIKEYIEEVSSVEEISGTVEIDMQILMDATGSMSSSIQAMSNAVIEMLDNIVADVKADTGFDAILRVGVVGYRDPFVGDESEFIPFTFDNAAVDQFLGNLAAVGGGDTEEDVNGGLKIMLDQEWTSEHKFIVHIADANGLGIPAPDAAGIDYADLFAEINEKQITYIFGKLNSNTDPMIAAYNEVYAVNEAGVLVEDASDAEIDILNLQGLSTSDMTATFTTELVNKIVTRVEEKVVTQELGQWAICDDLEEEDIVRDNKVLIVICGSTTIVICCCCFCVCCLMRKKEDDEDDKNIVVEVKIDGGDFDKRTPRSCTA